MKQTYKVDYHSFNKNRITLSKLKQSPMEDRYSNLKDAKAYLIRLLRRDLIKDTFSIEEKKHIKDRIIEVNKITKKKFHK